MKIKERRDRRRQRRFLQQHLPNGNNTSSGDGDDDFDTARNDRRLRILTNIIHTKVLMKKDTNGSTMGEDVATIEMPDGKSVSSQLSIQIFGTGHIVEEDLSDDDDDDDIDIDIDDGIDDGIVDNDDDIDDGDDDDDDDDIDHDVEGERGRDVELALEEDDDEMLSHDHDENDGSIRNNNYTVSYDIGGGSRNNNNYTTSYLQQIEDDFYSSSIVSMNSHLTEEQEGDQESGRQQGGKQQQETNTNLRKRDIYVENSHMIKTYSKKSMTLSKASSVSSLYSPKNCPICFEAYKEGDNLAWSKNTDCPHAFHLDCIIDWLMDNDDCPMCRGDYLCLDKDQDQGFF